jgi:NAD(P)-dependent dehydrogenase (short-subunit alcohol dehydrogenase family)
MSPADEHEHVPPQAQKPPGVSSAMRPEPLDTMEGYEGRGLLDGRKALITGGDSGIGRAVAIAFAKEGADVAIAYLEEHADAERTAELVKAEHRKCVLLPGDLAEAEHCKRVVEDTVEQLSGLDLLINNVATQRPLEHPEDITDEQWLHTFAVNLHSYFRVTQAALPHLGEGDAIVNCGSVNALRGNKQLIDYTATKGAIHSWTFAMAQALAPRGIRVNCVAPGPVWTPLIPSSFGDEMGEESVEGFGENVPMGRPAQPDEIAPSFVFLASNRLSSFYTGEVIAPLGGETMPG